MRRGDPVGHEVRVHGHADDQDDLLVRRGDPVGHEVRAHRQTHHHGDLRLRRRARWLHALRHRLHQDDHQTADTTHHLLLRPRLHTRPREQHLQRNNHHYTHQSSHLRLPHRPTRRTPLPTHHHFHRKRRHQNLHAHDHHRRRHLLDMSSPLQKRLHPPRGWIQRYVVQIRQC